MSASELPPGPDAEENLAQGFARLVASRRSIRRYRAEPVPPGVVERVLACAIWAPSAHNRQPWRFVLVETPALKSRLASAMGERLRADRSADRDDPVLIEADVARSHARITGAPVSILVCTHRSVMDTYLDKRRRRAEQTMAVQSAAMATQTLLLAAEAEGLGACILCAPLFCPEAVRDALGLPFDWDPQSLVTMGWPANAGKPARRRPLDEVVFRPKSPGG